MKEERTLRQRSGLYENESINRNYSNNDTIKYQEGSTNRLLNHMAYSRRNIATPLVRSSGASFPKTKNLASYRNKIIIILILTSFYTTFLYQRGGASTFLGSNSDSVVTSSSSGMNKMISAGRKLSVTTWNIAAINNNPFEYWITYNENKEYEKLMINIEKFLENPGEQDIPVNQVFTE